jgi:hypothetical protein
MAHQSGGEQSRRLRIVEMHGIMSRIVRTIAAASRSSGCKIVEMHGIMSRTVRIRAGG